MTLPGNCRPVSGSMIGWMVPFVTRVCEKSPRRSRSVGRLVRVTFAGRRSSVYSCDAKKYMRFSLRRLSITPGTTTGPPTL